MDVGEDFGEVVDRRAGHALGVEFGEPLGGRAGREDRLQNLGERVLVLRAQPLRLETRIVGQVGQADDRAGVAPEFVVAGRDRERLVGALETRIGRIARMGRAEAARRLAGAEIFARLQRRDAEERPEDRAVDMRALAGRSGPHHGREDHVSGVEPGREVADRHAALHGRALLLARHAHEAAHGLHGDVERALLGVRAGLAIAGDRAVDEPRIARLQLVVAEARADQRARPEVLDEHVRVLDQRVELGEIGLVLDVERDRPLVAVERGEVAGEHVIRAARALVQRRPAAHAVAAVGALDLDDVGAEIGEHHSGERPGGDLREFEDPEPLKRLCGHRRRSGHATSLSSSAA